MQGLVDVGIDISLKLLNMLDAWSGWSTVSRSESMLYGSLVFHKPIFVGGYDTG